MMELVTIILALAACIFAVLTFVALTHRRVPGMSIIVLGRDGGIGDEPIPVWLERVGVVDKTGQVYFHNSSGDSIIFSTEEMQKHAGELCRIVVFPAHGRSGELFSPERFIMSKKRSE